MRKPWSAGQLQPRLSDYIWRKSELTAYLENLARQSRRPMRCKLMPEVGKRKLLQTLD